MAHRIIVAAALCAALATPAGAQEAPRGPQPQGLWGAVSLGFAGTKTDCSNCTDPGYVGNGSTIIEVGGTISRHVRLGAELLRVGPGDGECEGAAGAAARAATRWYLDGDLPFYLKFGPDGHLYVSSGGSGQVIQYDGSTGALMGVFAQGSLWGAKLIFGRLKQRRNA